MSTTTFFCTNIHNHLYCYFTISLFYIQIFFTPCYSHVTHQRLQFRQLKDYNFLNHFSQRFFLKSWPCHILAAAPQYFHSAWCYDYGKSILWDNRGGEAWVCWQNVINDVCLFFNNTGSEVYDQLGPVWCNNLWPCWHSASCVWINSQSWVIWYQCRLDSWSGHSSFWNEVSKLCKTFLSVSSALRCYYSPLDGMPLHHKDTPGTSSGFPDNWPVPIYTPGWREAWGE